MSWIFDKNKYDGHSPDEWFVGLSPEDKSGDYICGDDGAMYTIAQISPMGKDGNSKEYQANRALIEDAPKILQEFINLIKDYDELTAKYEYILDSMSVYECDLFPENWKEEKEENE